MLLLKKIIYATGIPDSSLHPIHLDGVGGCRSGAGLGAQAIRRRQQVAPLRGNHHNCDVCIKNQYFLGSYPI
uniref:Uncharacterized protein n=1 Tax=Aegilops tauschii subsp. strangulata TaxID=200361 RepID=A0A453MFN1_AEGTS